MSHDESCDLCTTEGGTLIFRGPQWRVVRVGGAEGDAYTGFCRVVWNDHVREMTDLAPSDRTAFMEAVYLVERALRDSLRPHKINLASLGNLTPHLHWHVIPRYADDASFPKPIWAAPAPTTQPDGVLGTLVHRHAVESAQTDPDRDWETAVRRALETT